MYKPAPTLHARSFAAIRAAAFYDDVEIDFDGDSIVVRVFFGERCQLAVAKAHKLEDGRWMRAHWSDRHDQWQSADFRADFVRANPNTCCCRARELEALMGC
jgi:hypothetical protein